MWCIKWPIKTKYGELTEETTSSEDILLSKIQRTKCRESVFFNKQRACPLGSKLFCHSIRSKKSGGTTTKTKKAKKASGDFLFCLPNLFECPQRINNKILYRKKKKRTQVCKSWCVLPRKKCLQKEEERSNSTTLRRLLYLGRVWKWALQFVTVRTKEERVNDGERERERTKVS